MAENTTNNKKYDMVFIIDESGSMQEYIDKVKTNISDFVGRLKTEGVDVQLGLIEYGSGNLSIKKHNLTDNVDTFIGELNTIYAFGGGENGLSAIMDETNGAVSMNFRDGANKEFIVVTDEGYMENDSNYPSNRPAYSKDDVTAKLNQIGAKLDVFGAVKESYTSTGKAANDYWNAQDGDGWCQDEWTPIAESTSGYLINGSTSHGQFFNIEDNFFNLMQAAMRGTTDGGTHQLAFSQWSYGFTPSTEDNSAAALPIIAPGV